MSQSCFTRSLIGQNSEERQILENITLNLILH